MYRYLFTNDLRISSLNESLQKAGECFLGDKVPSASEDKSANNNMNTLGFYFNLTYKGVCAKAASEGKIRDVVFNFIKKFQFPNMRTTAAYNNSIEDGIVLAPMRVIVKVLYMMNLMSGSVSAYLTKEEIKYFIFYNEKVAKQKNPNYVELISQINDYRRTKTFPSNVDINESNHKWKQENRQLREMIKTLTWSGCVEEDGDKIRINNDNLTRDNKADIYDIINCSDYWNGSTIESYQQYMDMSEIELNNERNDVDYTLNEYEKAATEIRQHISEVGLVFGDTKEKVALTKEEFEKRYSPKELSKLSDDELLSRIFYTVGDNTEALCCWLEMNKDCKAYFGSIAGGSAYKFGLFQKKDTGIWTTGSPQKPQELSEQEAYILGKKIIKALLKGAKIIDESLLESVSDYEKLDDRLRAEVGERFYNWAWFHKYYSIVFSDKFSSFHNEEWQKHVLRCFGIRPSDKYYARSGQISMIQHYANLTYREMIEAIKDCFGDCKKFVRIGITSGDGEGSFSADWMRKSIVAMGWGQIGSLREYDSSQGLDKPAISSSLAEKYYPGDERTSSRKAGELVRFYNTDENTIFVAMEGEQIKGLVDEIGSYKYDSAVEFGHTKSGMWHILPEESYLPNRSEGKLTTCYELSDEDNMLYLYKKYYHRDEVDESVIDTDDVEERNKKLFRIWLEKQVKPEGDSDAGEPYSSNSIDQYISNVSNTTLSTVKGKSLFFTTEIGLIKKTITELSVLEKKNSTQRSALKKYLQFAIDTGDGDMSIVFKTSIETEYERNRIVFGAPGTGKSFLLKQDCEKLMEETVGTYERVTFHPDYTYSQFVGTYKPVMDADGHSIIYDFVPGPFMRVYVDALKSARTEAPQPHLLLIEEINRAKVAAVFGDVFQLLDRDVDGVSEYEIQATEDIRRYLAKELGGTEDKYKKIRIPNNMFIWATMNSADQGVYPMDTAFKRRWNFEYLGINEKEDDIKDIGKLNIAGYDEPIVWNRLRKAINAKMSSNEFRINEDKLMGPYFLSKKIIASNEDGYIIDEEKFVDAFKSKVIMYLYEDAVKQSKHKFFEGCDSSKYSSVCEAFDKVGMDIFGTNFVNIYYEEKETDIE